MFKLVITGEKGGTGKSTICALLIEYLNHLNKPVQLIDTDPLQITANYIHNCQLEGRIVSEAIKPDYQVIDTAGVLGASLLHIKQAQLVLVPFRAHYADLLVIIPWFTSLNTAIKQKMYFLPNYWRNTKEQREGLTKLQQVLQEEGTGQLLPPLSDKPALYGTILNGQKTNFFNHKVNGHEAKQVFSLIIP